MTYYVLKNSLVCKMPYTPYRLYLLKITTLIWWGCCLLYLRVITREVTQILRTVAENKNIHHLCTIYSLFKTVV